MSELSFELQKIQNQIILYSIQESTNFEYDDELERFFLHSNEPFTKHFLTFLIEKANLYNCNFNICFVLENIVTIIIYQGED